MSAAEPHPRRRRALRRALLTAVASGVLVVGGSGGPAVGQILPTSTTEPAPVTTEAEPEPEETTTTTEDELPLPTTTQRSAPTTRAPSATTSPSVDEDVGDEDDVVGDDGIDPGAFGDDEPAVDEAGETTTTERDLLVSGDGTEGAESTTTTSTTIVEVAADDGSLDEETQIWLIVAGLVVVAALIGVWTWRYWVRTKPVAVDDGPDGTTVFPSG